MKKKYLILITIMALMFLFNVSDIKSITTKIVTTYNFEDVGIDNPYGTIKETSEGTNLYCCEFYKNIPDGQTCSTDATWNTNSHPAAVIAYILRQNWTYRYKEVLINYYLGNNGFKYTCNSNSCVSGVKSGTRGSGGYPYIYIANSLKTKKPFVNAYNAIEDFKSKVPKKSASVSIGKNFEYVESEGYYEGVIKIYNMAYTTDKDVDINTKYNISFDTNQCSVVGLKNKYYPTTFNNYRDDVIIRCNKSVGGDNVKITVTSNKLYQSTRFDCGANYQKLMINDTSNRVVSVTAEIPIHEDTNICTTDECSCQQDLTNDIIKDPYQRIQFYKNHPEYQKFNNILNFEITDAPNACKASTKKITKNTSCLFAERINEEFSATNLSFYDYKFDVNGETAYCSKQVKIESNYSDIFTSGLSTVAGAPLFVSSDAEALRLHTNIRCYLYYDTSKEMNVASINSSLIKNEVLDEMVTNIQLTYRGDEVLKESNEKEIIETPTISGDGLYSFEKSMNKIYQFEEIKYQLITGRKPALSDIQISTGTYGIVSDFIDVTDNGNMIFTYKFVNDDNITSFSCPYIIEEDIISPKDRKIKLEFRTINTNNPFPGKNANENEARSVGINWCEMKEDGSRIETCSGSTSENKLISTVMSRNNSYNKTGDGAKYTITLTPSIINDIRNYNSKTKYDDVNLKCDKDVCISNYLTTLKNEGILTINNSEKRKIVKE